VSKQRDPDEPTSPDRSPDRAVVRVEPGDHSITVDAEESLLAAALRQGYRWPTLCNGVGQCTICFVKMIAGTEHVTPAQPQERERLEDCGRTDPDIRLACQMRVHGPITVFKRGLRKRT
jgi:ferredoxin, 2Fe-2S